MFSAREFGRISGLGVEPPISPEVVADVAEIEEATDSAAKPFQDILKTLNLASAEAYDVRDHLIGVFNAAANRLENILTMGDETAYVKERIDQYRRESARLQEIQGAGPGVPSEFMPVSLKPEKRTSRWWVGGLVAASLLGLGWLIWRK